MLPGGGRAAQGRVLVAHSASFDRRALRQAFERAGWMARPARLCTLRLAGRFAPLAGSASWCRWRSRSASRWRGAPRARGRGDLRARLLRAVPAPVRARAERRRRPRDSRARAAARAARRASAAVARSGPTSASCPTTQASTSSATSTAGRSTWASRCRCAAAPARTSARPPAGPRGPRWWTTSPPTRSSARSCSRTA